MVEHRYSASIERWSVGLRAAVLVIVVGGGYAAGSVLAYLAFNAGEAGTVLFPAAGVSLAALVLLGYRWWPLMLLTVAAAEITVDLLQGQPLTAAIGFAAANTLEPLLGAGLLRGVGGRVDLSRFRDLMRFVACAVVAGPLVGALIGATTIAWSLGRNWLDAFGPWWAGDGLGVLVVGGALLSWAAAEGEARTGRHWWEWTALILGAFVLTAAVFWPREVSVVALSIPVLFWAAYRFGVRGVTLTGAIVAVVANLLTAYGHGPWAGVAAAPNVKVATLQLVLSAVILSAWLLAVALSQREHERSTARFELEARHRADGLRRLAAELTRAVRPSDVAEAVVADGLGGLARQSVVAIVGPGGQDLLTLASWGLARPDPAGPAAEQETEPDGVLNAITLPAQAGRRIVGRVTFGLAEPGTPDEEVMAFARTVADLTGQALERSRLHAADHDSTKQLQRALLPTQLPELPGVTVAARYLPARQQDEVGGDFYDVLPLPGGRVGLVVGDVVGHDLRAAAAMGQLRSALAGVVTATVGPADALERLDNLAARIDGAAFTTVAYAEFDPATGGLRYASAGHPPLLLAAPGGRAGYLDGGRTEPLTAAGGPRTEQAVIVPDGAVLIGFTDGLIETRGGCVVTEMDRLRDVCTDYAGNDPAAMADIVLDRMTASRNGGAHDDTVVLCARLSRDRGRFNRTVPAEMDQLAVVRGLVRSWALTQQLTLADTDRILIASGEALANAIEHAYAGRPGQPIEVDVTLSGNALITVYVRDRGRWQRPVPGVERGRGLLLMERALGPVSIERHLSGTTLTVRGHVALE